MSFMDDFEYGVSNFFSLGGRSRREQTKAVNAQNKLAREQLDLQKDQYEYQKWFDQNNVTLGLSQNMAAGINPMVAQGAGTSSVTASANPQPVGMPNAVSPDTSLLSNLMSNLFDKKMNDDDLDIQEKKINNDKEVADKLIALKDKQLDLEDKRTSAYEDDVRARVVNLLQEYKKAVAGDYGRGTTVWRKLFGEFLELDRNSPAVADTLYGEFFKPHTFGKSFAEFLKDLSEKAKGSPQSNSPSVDTSDDYDAYLKHKILAEKRGHPNYTWTDWLQAGKPK